MARHDQFEGLAWIEDDFGFVQPQWTREPEIEAIRRAVHEVKPSQTVEISFLAQGGFNKLYDVVIDGQTSIFRVSLPVDPQHKTRSEVATMSWARAHTALPVPEVLAYRDSRENEAAFEWILMTKLPGRVYADVWKSVPFSSKETLVRQLAAYSATLFRKQMRGVGNIYTSEGSSTDPHAPEVEQIVSMHFFWADHLSLGSVSQGPFACSRDWISARLSLTEHDQTKVKQKVQAKEDADSDDEDEVEDAGKTLKIIDRLRAQLGTFFPTQDSDGNPISEPSMLFHDDMNNHNILVDDSGALTGVIDWECVSALPLWRACDYPAFLESRDEEADIRLTNSRPYNDEGEENDIYWERLLFFELTKLRTCFLDEMSRLEPGWMKVYKESQALRDFNAAVHDCDNVFRRRMIEDGPFRYYGVMSENRGSVWAASTRLVGPSSLLLATKCSHDVTQFRAAKHKPCPHGLAPLPGFNQEKAEPPPMGFALVLGPIAEAAVGTWFSFFTSTRVAFPIDPSTPLRRLPSSKNLLLPLSTGLATAAAGLATAELVEKVRLAVLGFKTLMPDSFRWYAGSLVVRLALAQSRLLAAA
ncbi:hypothetical protein LTR53_016853 [Teratosphaeriaceae sp. CCFEE 6253]|nr:hypothetical protein LTR53_016853 [Teratosphaeriaceae sp. CCFEE 6253]